MTGQTEEQSRPMVLVVDDDPTARALSRTALTQGGFEVAEAEDGVRALEVFQQLYPDIVLLDVLMPRMDGFEACSALRALPGGEHVPVIIATGLDDVESIARAYQAGATDFITKPVNWAILCHRVRYVLRASRIAAALRESEARYARAERGASDGLWDWDIAANRIYFSPRWMAMLGHEERGCTGTPEDWLSRVHPDDAPRVRVALTAYIQEHSAQFESEYRIRHQDGGYRWVLCRGLVTPGASGKPAWMAGSQADITRRKAAEEQLLHDAFHDVLTGLPNRALFLDRLERSIKGMRRLPGYMFAVIFLDLDRFKVINDSLGHLAGDQLLIAMSRRLTSCLRANDTVARLGGDEFTVLFEDVKDIAMVTRGVERIQQTLSEPLVLAGHELTVTASIGIALSTQGYERAEDVLRDADIALYRAKAQGRARHELFDTAMHARAVALWQLETDLRVALQRQELRLHYQPIAQLHSGAIIGFEALLRWQHPQRGLLVPGDFLSVAEDTGLIVPIGHWVLHEACRQMRAWQQRWSALCSAFISVNLSSKELRQVDLFSQIDQILQQTGLPAASLHIELTETVLIENTERATDLIKGLGQHGVRLAIDDFGTGYSSLSYLHRFPIETLKIDRSFVSRLGPDPSSREMVKTIITLARNMGMTVVAEGHETVEQAEALKELQCECVQGNFFARPMEGEAIAELMDRSASVPDAAKSG